MVDRLVTSLAVIEVTPNGLRLLERAPGVSVDEIRAATEPELLVDGDVPEVAVPDAARQVGRGNATFTQIPCVAPESTVIGGGRHTG